MIGVSPGRRARTDDYGWAVSVTTGTGASAPFSRFAVWLTRQSAADLFGAFLVWFVAWSVVSALVLELLLDTTGQRDVALAGARSALRVPDGVRHQQRVASAG
jgi:hypothetical protein